MIRLLDPKGRKLHVLVERQCVMHLDVFIFCGHINGCDMRTSLYDFRILYCFNGNKISPVFRDPRPALVHALFVHDLLHVRDNKALQAATRITATMMMLRMRFFFCSGVSAFFVFILLIFLSALSFFCILVPDRIQRIRNICDQIFLIL